METFLSPPMMYNPSAFAAIGLWIVSVLTLVLSIWMIIDCVRSGREFYWIYIIIIFWGIGALVYFFAYYFDASTFFRGAIRRQQLRNHLHELEGRVHSIDNAYHRSKLADAYRELRRLSQAEEQYRAALNHDPKLFEGRVHLGYVLLDEGKAGEARELLENAADENPDYEFGELMRYTARAAKEDGDLQAAKRLYENLLKRYTYPGPRLEYAEVLYNLGEKDDAIEVLSRLVKDSIHMPKFQKKPERKTMRRARKLLRSWQSK